MSATELIIFHAGSLSVPLKEISTRFQQLHPGVEIKAEAAGSRESARKISELGRPCDVMAAADFDVIDQLLIPQHAAFNIRFACNELGIACGAKAKMGEQITATNWAEIMLRDDVAFGRADPNADPCGYRTVMLFQLAEKHFQKPGLADKLAAKNEKRFMRPKETDLLALLESGEIDYLFIYRSVALQHKLKFLRLPDEINLSSSKRASLYAGVSVPVSGKKPGETILQKGLPIVYAVTVPAAAPHRELALAYVELLLSPEGQEIMKRNAQMPLSPAISQQFDALPESMKKLCTGLEKP
ncbi:MAG TPA: tungstate ABC transporter substrate-binding protein WtpA [Planctomycetota bacterium]